MVYVAHVTHKRIFLTYHQLYHCIATCVQTQLDLLEDQSATVTMW